MNLHNRATGRGEKVKKDTRSTGAEVFQLSQLMQTVGSEDADPEALIPDIVIRVFQRRNNPLFLRKCNQYNTDYHTLGY